MKSLYRIFSHDGCYLLTVKLSSSMDHSWYRDRVILSGSELSEASCVPEGLLFRFEGDLYLIPSTYRYLIAAYHARLVR